MNKVNNQFFVGIDISKNTLDYTISKRKAPIGKGQIENTQKGLNKLKKHLKAEKVNTTQTLFCCENTGLYNTQLLAWTQKNDYKIWVVSASEIKKSMGITRGKTDPMDADRIALYAYRFEDKLQLWVQPRDVVKKLKALIAVRESIMKMKGQAQRKLKEIRETQCKADYKFVADYYKVILAEQKKALKKVDQDIKVLVRSDEEIARKTEQITSVEGAGIITATTLIICSNVFQRIKDPRKMACYAGIAPFPHSSGTSVHKRTAVSMLANKDVKRVLHMAALAAAFGKGELAEYYQRKVREGKHKMSVLNAIRNKIIHRIYACLRDDRLYQKTYTKKLA